MDYQEPKAGCPHATILDVQSEGGAVIGYQCATCHVSWGLCKECRTPLDESHKTHRQGCIKCKQGDFCNVKQRLCVGCAPAQDGVCALCKRFFGQTGRQAKAGKLYCSKTCQGRVVRDRKKEREAADAPPPAEPVKEPVDANA